LHSAVLQGKEVNEHTDRLATVGFVKRNVEISVAENNRFIKSVAVYDLVFNQYANAEKLFLSLYRPPATMITLRKQ